MTTVTHAPQYSAVEFFFGADAPLPRIVFRDAFTYIEGELVPGSDRKATMSDTSFRVQPSQSGDQLVMGLRHDVILLLKADVPAEEWFSVPTVKLSLIAPDNTEHPIPYRGLDFRVRVTLCHPYPFPPRHPIVYRVMVVADALRKPDGDFTEREVAGHRQLTQLGYL